MSSMDKDVSSKQDSLLLFQFSRPQNLIKFWQFKTEVQHIHFMDTDPEVLMVINKNGEMQRIYCCYTKLQLQKQGKEKAERFETKKSALEQKVTDAVKVDYTFIQNEKRLE